MAGTLSPKGKVSKLDVCNVPPARGRGRTRRSTTAKPIAAKAKSRSSAAPGSMERSRRLLLAALRVWELKHRPRG